MAASMDRLTTPFRSVPWITLPVILAWGASLRFLGLDWDAGQHLHPDERFLTMVETALKWPTQDLLGAYFNEATSTLNPRNVGYKFYVYGDFPIVLVKGLSVLLDRTGYDAVHLVGRAVVALVDIGTIAALFLLGRTLYRDDRIAALGALLYASAALAIQQAHFFVVDSFSGFFITLALLFLVRVAQDGRFVDYLLAGGLIGVSLASKLSVYSIVAIVVVVAAYRLYLAWPLPAPQRKIAAEQIAVRVFACGIAAIVAFRLFQPYAFQTPSFQGIALAPRWLENIDEVRGWVSGEREAPFAWQWTARTPLLFPLQNMVLWGMGVPLSLTAWAGTLVAAWRLARGREWAHLVPITWTLLFFLLLGTQWVKSMRYFLPIYPTLCLLAGWWLISLWDQSRARVGPALTRPVRPRLLAWAAWTPAKAGALLGLVVLGTVLYALAFTSIYTRPHTRAEASRWIYANVPPGTVVANETQWDDGLPLRVDGKDGFAHGMYTGVNLDITAGDSPKKLDAMLGVLDRVDYLFISSNRQYDAMARLPMRFPLTVKYYDALFAGRLGFERVGEFTSYPSLLGLSLPDQGAEEAWSVYDHPRVQIFKKRPEFSRADAAKVLGGVDYEAIVELAPRQATAARNALLLSPEDRATQQSGGTWSELFDVDSVSNKVPVAVWVLVVLLLGFTAVPYLWVVAASLPDRGYALARPVGLLLVGWLVWLLASLHAVPFSRGSILMALVLLAAGAALIVRRHRRQMAAWLRAPGTLRLLLAEEGVYWAAFGTVLAVRWANPDLWHPILGGEKPMDFAYLNAVVKSTYFPPYDPWFAGGYINYYYFGFVLVGTLVKLTGIVPAVAYNLAIPTFFAGLASAAFGATLALVGSPNRLGLPTVGKRTIAFAALGALCVAVLGNLAELMLLLEGLHALSRREGPSDWPLLAWFIKTADGALSLLSGQSLPFRPEWPYWNPTRVIDHAQGEPVPITEFPWFTFLYADLHAHLMALPYAATAVALALCLVRDDPAPAETAQAPGRSWWRSSGTGRFILLALVIGALWPTNTWDFPTYALVALAALALRGWRAASGRLSAGLLASTAGAWVMMLALGYLFFLPFHQNYGTAVSGLEPWRGSRTPLHDYLTIHGFFLFLISGALVADFRLARDLNGVARMTRLMVAHPFRWARLAALHERLVHPTASYTVGRNLLVFGSVLAAALALVRNGVPALIVALMTLTVLLFFRRERVPAAPDTGGLPLAPRLMWQMTLVLIFAGLAITLAVELMVLKNIDIGRMNTVFKFYLQVWVLWGLAAAAGAARVATLQRLPRFGDGWRQVWRLGFVALFAATALYPVLATRAKINDRFDRTIPPTLDGMAFMDKATLRLQERQITLAHDQDAIRWMQQNVQGSPVIAEANTHPTLYGWGNRFAMFAGNPSVIGWDWHQRQQRSVVPGTMISRRIEEVQKLYSTTNAEEAHRLLSLYDVQYVVVGELERAQFPQGAAKWEQSQGSHWQMVYENPGVRIYRVLAMEDSTASGNGRLASP